MLKMLAAWRRHKNIWVILIVTGQADEDSPKQQSLIVNPKGKQKGNANTTEIIPDVQEKEQLK